MEKIEYRVRLVKRYVVTRFYQNGDGVGSSGGSEMKGEFDNEESAYQVGYALAKDEHQRLGWPLNDERMQYPKRDDGALLGKIMEARMSKKGTKKKGGRPC